MPPTEFTQCTSSEKLMPNEYEQAAATRIGSAPTRATLHIELGRAPHVGGHELVYCALRAAPISPPRRVYYAVRESCMQVSVWMAPRDLRVLKAMLAQLGGDAVDVTIVDDPTHLLAANEEELVLLEIEEDDVEMQESPVSGAPANENGAVHAPCLLARPLPVSRSSDTIDPLLASARRR